MKIPAAQTIRDRVASRDWARLRSRAGFWSAILTTLIFLLYDITFSMMVSASGAHPWQGMNAYATSYQRIEFVPEAIGLVLIPVLLVLLACIHTSIPAYKKTWSLVGLAFGVAFAVIVGSIYFLQVTVVRQSLLKGEADAVALLAMANPHSIAWAANSLGWGFLGLATFFTGLAFEGGGLERSIRWLFMLNGLLSGLAMVGFMLDSIPLQVGAMVSWTFGLPAATALIGLWFRKT